MAATCSTARTARAEPSSPSRCRPTTRHRWNHRWNNRPMEPVPDATVYIVDDDTDVREALAWLLRSRRLLSECYDSAEAFDAMLQDRKSTRLNSSHLVISYAVFCLKKK